MTVSSRREWDLIEDHDSRVCHLKRGSRNQMEEGSKVKYAGCRLCTNLLRTFLSSRTTEEEEDAQPVVPLRALNRHGYHAWEVKVRIREMQGCRALHGRPQSSKLMPQSGSALVGQTRKSYLKVWEFMKYINISAGRPSHWSLEWLSAVLWSKPPKVRSR